MTYIPPRIKRALLFARSLNPDVDRVVYWSDDRWTYLNSEGHSVSLAVDQDLEKAREAAHIINDALRDLNRTPVAYQWVDYETPALDFLYQGGFGERRTIGDAIHQNVLFRARREPGDEEVGIYSYVRSGGPDGGHWQHLRSSKSVESTINTAMRFPWNDYNIKHYSAGMRALI